MKIKILLENAKEIAFTTISTWIFDGIQKAFDTRKSVINSLSFNNVLSLTFTYIYKWENQLGSLRKRWRQRNEWSVLVIYYWLWKWSEKKKNH